MYKELYDLIKLNEKVNNKLTYDDIAERLNISRANVGYKVKFLLKCGYLSKNYSESRVKKCKNCNHEIDRDINGARNILLKNKDLIFKTLNKVEIKRRGSKVAEVEQHQVKNSKRSPISKPQMSTSKKRVRNLNPVHSGK